MDGQKVVSEQVSVSGKRKRGGRVLGEGERLAIVKCGEENIEILSPMPCKLLELNLDLLENPQHLKEEQGWIAILMPDPRKLHKYLSKHNKTQ